MLWPEFAWLVRGLISRDGTHLSAHFFPPKSDPAEQPEDGGE